MVPAACRPGTLLSLRRTLGPHWSALKKCQRRQRLDDPNSTLHAGPYPRLFPELTGTRRWLAS